jgi:hypothetical protein
MSYKTNSDNIYKVDTIITAKVNPGVKLMIRKYYQRSYYCTVIGQPDSKELVYFERELLPPARA